MWIKTIISKFLFLKTFDRNGDVFSQSKYSQKQSMGVFYKKGVIKNFTKLTGNSCAREHFIKKETLRQVFSCESWEHLLRAPFS